MSTSLVHRLNIFNMIGSLLLTGYLVRSSWSEPNLPMGAGTTVQTAEPVQKTRPEGYIPTVKEIFSDLEEPLLESIMQKELYPKDYLPSQELIDRAIGRLRDLLVERGQWDDTLLIVTSGHGEAFFEHGLYRYALLLELILIQLPYHPS